MVDRTFSPIPVTTKGILTGLYCPPLDENLRTLETFPFSPNPTTLGYFSVSSVTAQATRLSHVAARKPIATDATKRDT